MNFWKTTLEAVGNLNPTDEEIESVEQWMSTLDDITMTQLSYNGDFATYGMAETHVQEKIKLLNSDIETQRVNNPLSVASLTAMAAEVENSIRAAAISSGAEGESGMPKADATQWLWSPIGPPTYGNSAGLTGLHRYEAHLTLVNAAVPLDDDPAAIVQNIEQDSYALLADCASQMDEHRESLADVYAQRDAFFAQTAIKTQEAHSHAAGLTKSIVDQIFDAWEQEVLLSSIVYECVSDALAWLTLDTATRLKSWQHWLKERISFMGEGLGARDRAEMEYLWWTAAELLVTSERLQARHGADLSKAAHQLAHFITGRADGVLSESDQA